jgi:hypothetical protein
MAKHYFILSDHPKHGAMHTKGLRNIFPKTSGYTCIEFHYVDGKTYSWWFDSEKNLMEAYNKIKKSIPNGVNIDDITL